MEPGGTATVRLRVPRASAVDAVAVRYVTDGEPHIAVAEVDEEGADETWWRASFRVLNPATPYRWLLSGGAVGYGWVTGEGLVAHDVPDSDDFVLRCGRRRPGLARRRRRVPGLPRPLRPLRRPTRAARLGGSARLGRHPHRVGPRYAARVVRRRPRGRRGPPRPPRAARRSILYTTPFFQARSTHRYNATSFDHVDPLLGGDEALVALVRAAHARGIRVIGDLTINHIGDDHPWFESARDANAPERALLLVRRAARARVRGVGRRPHAAEARPPRRGAPPPPARRRRGRRPALAASPVRPRRLAARRREHGRAARRGRRGP